jgi:hypothetical protein
MSPVAVSCKHSTPRIAGLCSGNFAWIFTLYAGIPGTVPGKRIVAVPGPGNADRTRCALGVELVEYAMKPSRSGPTSDAGSRRVSTCDRVRNRVDMLELNNRLSATLGLRSSIPFG